MSSPRLSVQGVAVAMAVLVGALLVAPGCATTTSTDGASATSTTAVTGTTQQTGQPAGNETTSSPEESVEPGAGTIRDQLARLSIDDHSQPDRSYDRHEWPHWADIDGDGCDAREQALRDQSHTPAQVDPFGCKVLTGDWVSPYDGVSGDDPSDFDIDHIVPLANAFRSGGWRWNVDQRRHFANDQANLLVVSASSNRSKGDRSPDQWRPPRRESWCENATRWVEVKVSYGLTATTEERDALGQMLETC